MKYIVILDGFSEVKSKMHTSDLTKIMNSMKLK